MAAAITGLSAMLTEGVHSVVDLQRTYQLLMIWGRRQAAKLRRQTSPVSATAANRISGAFVVAVLVFSLGAGVSVDEGIIHIASPNRRCRRHSLCRLIVAFSLEGLVHAPAFQRISRKQRASLGWIQHPVEASKDSPAFIVLLQNGAGWLGLVAAAIGFPRPNYRRSLLPRRRLRRDRTHSWGYGHLARPIN